MIGPSAVMTSASGDSLWPRAGWNASENDAKRTMHKISERRMYIISGFPD
jgi:hypothetical protein